VCEASASGFVRPELLEKALQQTSVSQLAAQTQQRAERQRLRRRAQREPQRHGHADNAADNLARLSVTKRGAHAALPEQPSGHVVNVRVVLRLQERKHLGVRRVIRQRDPAGHAAIGIRRGKRGRVEPALLRLVRPERHSSLPSGQL